MTLIAVKIRHRDLTEEWFEVVHADADIPGITWLYNSEGDGAYFFVTPQDIVQTHEEPSI